MVHIGVCCPFSELLHLYHQGNNLNSLGNVADRNHMLFLAELSFIFLWFINTLNLSQACVTWVEAISQSCNFIECFICNFLRKFKINIFSHTQRSVELKTNSNNKTNREQYKTKGGLTVCLLL